MLAAKYNKTSLVIARINGDCGPPYLKVVMLNNASEYLANGPTD